MSEYSPLDIHQQQRKKAEDEANSKAARKEEEEDWKWLMSSRRGRRIVWRILSRTGVFRLSFTGNSETYFREGERNVGLQVMDLIHRSSPEQYPTMVQEQQENDRHADHGTN